MDFALSSLPVSPPSLLSPPSTRQHALCEVPVSHAALHLTQSLPKAHAARTESARTWQETEPKGEGGPACLSAPECRDGF